MEDHAQIVSSTASAAFAVDTGGRILAWNPSAEQLLGYPASKVLGRSCWDVVQGQDPYGNVYCGSHCPLIEMALHRQVIHGCELLCRDAEGKMMRASVNSLIVAGRSPDEMAIVHLLCLVRYEASGDARRPERESAKAKHLLLTEREFQVLRLMARGDTTCEISRELRISNGTVRHHCAKVLRSLKVHTRLQAVATARVLHLID